MNFDEWCKFFEENELYTVSVEGAQKKVYLNEDKSLCITIEERNIELTQDDERRIRERLKALGYMIDD